MEVQLTDIEDSQEAVLSALSECVKYTANLKPHLLKFKKSVGTTFDQAGEDGEQDLY